MTHTSPREREEPPTGWGLWIFQLMGNDGWFWVLLQDQPCMAKSNGELAYFGATCQPAARPELLPNPRGTLPLPLPCKPTAGSAETGMLPNPASGLRPGSQSLTDRMAAEPPPSPVLLSKQ